MSWRVTVEGEVLCAVIQIGELVRGEGVAGGRGSCRPTVLHTLLEPATLLLAILDTSGSLPPWINKPSAMQLHPRLILSTLVEVGGLSADFNIALLNLTSSSRRLAGVDFV